MIAGKRAPKSIFKVKSVFVRQRNVGIARDSGIAGNNLPIRIGLTVSSRAFNPVRLKGENGNFNPFVNLGNALKKLVGPAANGGIPPTPARTIRRLPKT